MMADLEQKGKQNYHKQVRPGNFLPMALFPNYSLQPDTKIAQHSSRNRNTESALVRLILQFSPSILNLPMKAIKEYQKTMRFPSCRASRTLVFLRIIYLCCSRFGFFILRHFLIFLRYLSVPGGPGNFYRQVLWMERVFSACLPPFQHGFASFLFHILLIS
jgi:hypothetical protein